MEEIFAADRNDADSRWQGVCGVLRLALHLAGATAKREVAYVTNGFGAHLEALACVAEETGIGSLSIVGKKRRLGHAVSKLGVDVNVFDEDEAPSFDAIVAIGGNAGVARLLGSKLGQEIAHAGAPCSYMGWQGVEDCVKHLSPNGRAVFALPTKFLGGRGDIAARRHLLEMGWIEAAIELDEGYGLFAMDEGVSLLVLSKGNDCVALVDSAGYDLVNDYELAEEMIELDFGHIDRVDVADIVASSSMLKASLWEGGTCARHFVPLGELAEKIGRGTTLKAEELKRTTPFVPGSGMVWYLAVGDLEHAVLGELDAGSATMPVGDIPDNQRRYLAEAGDIVLNKMRPFSTAILRFEEGDDKALPSGNLFTIRLDRSKADPQYVLAYLMGEDGQEQLMRAAYSHATPSITKADLEGIEIAVDTMAEQERVSKALCEMRDKVIGLERKIDAIRRASRELVN